MDSDVEFTRPSRAPRLRANQPPTNEPRRHPKIGGTTPKPKESSEEISEDIERVISLFTISPDSSGIEEFNVEAINRDPDNPHDWTSVVVSKTIIQEITDPDGSVTKHLTPVVPPMTISQKLLDRSIVRIEEQMKKLAQEKQIGSAEYFRQQDLRERMLDVYRHASAAS